MDRRCFLLASLGGAMAVPMAEAQRAGKLYRIGYLSAGSRNSNPGVLEAFRHGLRELGWVEGRNIVIEYRWAEGRFDRLPDLAAELVRLNVDLIVASPTPAAIAAKNATGSIPIVGMSLTDPIGSKLIASLAHPGGNVTGVSYSVGAEIFAKHLELLSEILPKGRLVGVLSNPASPARPRTMSNIQDAAKSLGVRLHLVEARGPEDFDRAFVAMVQERVGGVLVVTDPAFIPCRARLIDLTMKNRLPSIFTQTEDAEAGGLMSYGPRLSVVHRRGAAYVDKILKGAKPADLPVEEPTTFALVINLKTAKALGLAIPPSLLARADQVIE
jgi:putative tryptophan/tyrosine transport system substrate-binding protein